MSAGDVTPLDRLALGLIAAARTLFHRANADPDTPAELRDALAAFLAAVDGA